MKSFLPVVGSLLAACFVLVVVVSLGGCDDTARGVSKDAGEAGDEVRANAKKAGVAVSIIPKIQVAFSANPFLNGKENDIKIEQTERAIVLRGTVKESKNIALAETMAREVMMDDGTTLNFMNELKLRF
jgi:osmotically-inducible protein OsmY